METELIDKVLKQTGINRDFNAKDVLTALDKEVLNIEDFAALLSPAAEEFLEQIAMRSKTETRKQFGNSVSLYTPLYISNYCDNQCIYCGFNLKNEILRGKLSLEEIEKELQAISKTGLEEILLLTGESRSFSNVEYIGEAVKLASKYFTTVGIEIYPLNVDEYAYLNQCGADFVSIYQETYDLKTYLKYHISGPKRSFVFRFNSQERAIQGGMRGVSFGSLFGLGDFRTDALATGLHAYYFQKKYPHAEISLSAPRLRNYFNNKTIETVSEKQLLLVFMAFRIFLPYSTIVVSTREREQFRDNLMGLAANKMSAGVTVGVGGHSEEKKGDEQFEISDPRSVNQINNMLINRDLQPVFTDYIRLN